MAILTIENVAVQNFKERINSRSLILDLVEDDLGQTFEPYIGFGVVYWTKPKLLVSHLLQTMQL